MTDENPPSLVDYVVLNRTAALKEWFEEHPGAVVNPDTKNMLQDTLRQAVRSGRHEIAEFLLHKGVAPDPDEDNPDFDEEKSAVADAVARDDWRMVGLLVENGANDLVLSPMDLHKANTWRFMNDDDDVLPDTNLIDHVLMGNAAAVQEWFITHPDANPNEMQPHQMKPALVIAVGNGNTQIAEILLQNGANPNLKDKQFGFSALHEAVSRNDLEMTDLVLRYGASVNQPSEEILATPLHMAAADRRPESVPILTRLLAVEDVNPDLKDAFGNTALHYAATTPFLEKTEKLVAHSASWKLINHNSDTPLACAEENKTDSAAFLRGLMTAELTRNLGIDTGEWRKRRDDEGPGYTPSSRT